MDCSDLPPEAVMHGAVGTVLIDPSAFDHNPTAKKKGLNALR
jgi:hypothetical protein